eukprot:COSAG05_NODE_436_length_9838_cov_49.389876_3_plen_75_part_00
MGAQLQSTPSHAMDVWCEGRNVRAANLGLALLPVSSPPPPPSEITVVDAVEATERTLPTSPPRWSKKEGKELVL